MGRVRTRLLLLRCLFVTLCVFCAFLRLCICMCCMFFLCTCGTAPHRYATATAFAKGELAGGSDAMAGAAGCSCRRGVPRRDDVRGWNDRTCAACTRSVMDELLLARTPGALLSTVLEDYAIK